MDFIVFRFNLAAFLIIFPFLSSFQLSTAAPNLSLKGTPYWMAPEVRLLVLHINFMVYFLLDFINYNYYVKTPSVF